MSAPRRVRLGVNLDHVATLRQARGTRYPEMAAAIRAVEAGGADGITLHLREDRRHAQDADLELAREIAAGTLNMEMAATPDMLAIAARLRPDFCCLVPERREELTTEGGLNVAAHQDALRDACARLADAGIRVSLFVEPEAAALETARALGAPIVELHTGAFADAADADAAQREFERLRAAAEHAHALGLEVHAGHGLRRDNARVAARLPHMRELNIGHALVADAVFMGLRAATRAMKEAMDGNDAQAERLADAFYA